MAERIEMERYTLWRFDTAANFLAALRRSNPLWLPKNDWDCLWLFRGQEREGWSLVPRVWRKSLSSHPLFIQYATDASIVSDDEANGIVHDLKLRGFRDVDPERVKSLLRLKRFEVVVIRVFAWMADGLGLRIPGGGFQWHERYGATIHYGPIEDEQDRYRFARALAQHHGMPTRILDWTHSPEVAAFFAAEPVAFDQSEPIAVWALNVRALNPASSGVRLLTVDRSDFGFLHAQEGLFTWIAGADLAYLSMGEWPAVDGAVSRLALSKLILPASESTELKRLLWAEGYSRAHLMPTLDNVTKALESVWRDSSRIKRQMDDAIALSKLESEKPKRSKKGKAANRKRSRG